MSIERVMGKVAPRLLTVPESSDEKRESNPSLGSRETLQAPRQTAREATMTELISPHNEPKTCRDAHV